MSAVVMGKDPYLDLRQRLSFSDDQPDSMNHLLSKSHFESSKYSDESREDEKHRTRQSLSQC